MASYRAYMERSMTFIRKRNQGIAAYAERHVRWQLTPHVRYGRADKGVSSNAADRARPDG